jgi:hypothetical protein
LFLIRHATRHALATAALRTNPPASRACAPRRHDRPARDAEEHGKHHQQPRHRGSVHGYKRATVSRISRLSNRATPQNL